MDKGAKVKLLVVGILCLIVFSLFFVFAEGVEIGEGDSGKETPKTAVLWSRTASTETWKNPDGTYTTTLYSGQMFIDDKTKRYPNYVLPQDSMFQIKPTNKSGYDFILDSEFADYKAYFKNNTNTAGAVRFEKDGYFFNFDISGGQMLWAEQDGSPARTDTLGSGAPSNSQNTQIVTDVNKANYSNAYYNTDTIYTLNFNMLKEVLVLKGLPSYKAYNYLRYSGAVQFNKTLTVCANDVCYTPSGTEDDFETSGRIDFRNENGETIFYLPEIQIWDSNGNYATGKYRFKGSNAQGQFYLYVNKTFLQNAVYPVYIDPTISLKVNTTENLEDAVVTFDAPDTNYGLLKFLVISPGISTSPNDFARRTYINFNISSIENTMRVINSTLFLYRSGGDDENPNITQVGIYHVNKYFSQGSITWNNQPCNATFGNYTNCNITTNSITYINNSKGFKWYNFEVTTFVEKSLEVGSKNISLVLKAVYENNSRYSMSFESKESTTLVGKYLPYLNITYTPRINIISPTPSQIFTENSPTTSFNISTAENMSACNYTLNRGITNMTMTSNASQSGFSTLNVTMVDGTNTVQFFCNNQSGTIRASESITFEVDSQNITRCRNLYTNNRDYHLMNNLSVEETCLNVYSNYSNIHLLDKKIKGDSGSSDYGLRVYGKYVNITNANMSDFGEGCIRFQVENGSIITNGSFYSCSSAVYYLNNKLTSASNLKINKSDYAGIELVVSNVTISDTKVTESTTADVQVSSVNGFLMLKNVTYSSESVSGYLIRKWYFQQQVNNSAGGLNSATVQIWDKDGNLIFSETTNASGGISRKELTEYTNNAGVKDYLSPYMVNVSLAPTYVTNSTIYNLTSLTNVYSQVVLQTANAPPSVVLKSPTNGYNSSTTTYNLVCNQTDTNGKNVTLITWNSTNAVENRTTNTTSTTTNSTTFATPFALQGTYKWNCLACDTSHSCAFASANFTITIDSINPSANQSSPLNNTNSTVLNQNLTVNVTDNLGIKNITMYVVNATNDAILNETTTTLVSGITTKVVGWVYNFVDGIYKWFYRVSDWSGNTISTQNYSLSIDSKAPVVTIITPTPGQVFNSGAGTINYSIHEEIAGVSACWFTNNSGTTNHSLNCGTNITFNLADGNYIYTIYSNDTYTNNGSTSISFGISTGAPAVTLNYPSNTTYFNSKLNNLFNFTAIDADGLGNCTLYGNFDGTWKGNYTWNLPESGKMNWTRINGTTEGIHLWNVYCNDSVQNRGSGLSNLTFIVDTINPNSTQSGFSPDIVYTETDVTFYANISDVNLNSVMLQINYSTTYTNISVTTATGHQYYYTLSDAEIDNFEAITWMWIANDSAGNRNTSLGSSFNVTNRNPHTINFTQPENNSFINTNWFYINFSSTEPDGDTLNYTLYNSSDGTTFSIFNSTTLTYFNYTNFSLTDGGKMYFYVTANDTKLQNQTDTLTITMDTVNPSIAGIDSPPESPTVICNLFNINLNYSVSDTNLDYCIFNATSTVTGAITSANTIVYGCVNVTFNSSIDGITHLLSLRVVDKAGNINSTSMYFYTKTTDSSCGGVGTGSPGGGGGTIVAPEVEVGYCGDGFCEADRGETFWNCPEDCSVAANLTLESLICNPLSEDPEEKEKCFWSRASGLTLIFVFIGVFFIFILFFEFKPSEKKITKKFSFRPSKWKLRKYG